MNIIFLLMPDRLLLIPHKLLLIHRKLNKKTVYKPVEHQPSISITIGLKTLGSLQHRLLAIAPIRRKSNKAATKAYNIPAMPTLTVDPYWV